MKKGRKWLALLLVMAMLMLTAAGCAGGTGDGSQLPPDNGDTSIDDGTGGPDGTVEGKTGKICLILKSLNHAFFAAMQKGAEDTAKKLGMELYVDGVTDESDSEGMIAIMENAITQECDVIAVTISDSTAMIPTIKKANDAGIKVLTIDARVDEAALKAAGAEVVTFIGTDNYDGGYLVGQYCAELYKDSKEEVQVAVITGLPGTETATNRNQGFLDGIASNDKIKVVASQNADWEIEKGLNVTQNILQANPDIKFIFGCNDYMALGALKAAQAAKLDDIVVVGFDAIQDSLDSISEGALSGTLGQYPGKMGAWAVELAYDLVKDPNTKVPETLFTGCYVVTADNLADYQRSTTEYGSWHDFAG